MPLTNRVLAFAAAATVAVASSATFSTTAAGDPGVNQPTSYYPSDASLTDVPTYLTNRVATTANGIANG